MELTDAQRAACAAMEDSWYWQVLERGKWRYRWHNEVMVRYYECAPLEADVFAAMIEYLQGQTGITAIQLHGKRIELDGEWKAVRAWYETRDGDTSETNKLKRVRICQALEKNSGEAGGDGPYVVENGCMYKVEHTFHWNAEALPELPASSSGVNYQIQAVTRDDERGLWNCVVERRERVQQDVPEYTSEKTVFETKKEEQHLGVKQGDVDGTGKAARAGGGETVTRKLRKNEDCTTDVVNETTVEEAVPEAVTETEMNLRGAVKTTVNRNMAAKKDETNLDVGETVKNEKTPGGRWTQTIRKVIAAAAGKIRRVCRRTVFRHTDMETTNVKRDPGTTHVVTAGDGVMRELEVQRREEGTYDVTETTHQDIEASGAVTETRKYLDGTVRRTVNRNQKTKASEAKLEVGDSVRNEKTETGLWDQTIEKASPEATGDTAETCEQTALVHAHSKTEGVGKGRPSGEAPSGGGGKTYARRIAKTERGAWNVTTETRTAIGKTIVMGGGSQDRHVKTTVVRNGNVPTGGAGPANVEVERSGTINEFGLFDGTERRITHGEAKRTATGGAAKRKVVVETAINSLELPVSDGEAPNEETEVSVSPNEHGSMSWTKRKVKYEETREKATSGGPLVEVERVNAANAPKGADYTYNSETEGEVADLSANRNQHDTLDYTLVKRKCHEKNKLLKWDTDDGTHVDTHFVYVFRNTKMKDVKKPEEIDGLDFGDSGKPTSASMSISINEFGTVDGVISGIAQRKGSDSARTSSDDQGEMSDCKKYVGKIVTKNKVPYRYRFELTYDMHWGGSSAWLQKKWKEVAETKGNTDAWPELGIKSGISGGVLTVYKTCKLVSVDQITTNGEL